MSISLEYDSFVDRNHALVDLCDAINDFGQWNDSYAIHPIYCPECGAAELKFTAKTSNHVAYLSTMPSSSHRAGCSHEYKKAPKRIATAYYRNCTREQAVDKLAACINLLRRSETPDNQPPAFSMNHNHQDSPFIIRDSGEGQRRYRLQTKSFYSIYKLRDSDMDYPIAFYGKVRLSIHEKSITRSDGSVFLFNTISVRSTKDPSRILNSIYFDHHKLAVNENVEYFFSMLGTPSRKGNFININFKDRDYTLYQLEEA